MRPINFVMPKTVDKLLDESTETYGKIQVYPLEKGYGTTVGNALRRVILASIPGAALVAVRFEGVQHEFSTIPGVVEDVSEIVLNLKQLRVKLISEGPKTINTEIKRHGPGPVTAEDLHIGGEIFIQNPDLVIANIENGVVITVEMTFETGFGYEPSESRNAESYPIGTIVLDALFSPVIKVNYNVEATRVSQRTDYDKLTLEIWTDGSIHPFDALEYGADLLREHLKIFLEEKEERIPIVETTEFDEEKERIRRLMKRSVDELELSVRSANCLANAGIKTISDLVQKTEQEMLRYRNFGRKSLKEISGILDGMGLSFGLNVEEYE
jgi:DNA-directed RNA polymerase subunit alpha